MPTSGTRLDIEASLRPQTASKAGLKVLTGANGDETAIGYDAAAGRVYIDRTRSGTAASAMAGFYGVHSAPLALRDGKLNLRALVDNSIVEVFANGGERVLSDLVYPAAGSDGLRVFAEGGTAALDSISLHRMRSTWPVPAQILRYGGPTSNDAVTITFKQAIAEAEPLRTGNYAKTLTFTLSTTTP